MPREGNGALLKVVVLGAGALLMAIVVAVDTGAVSGLLADDSSAAHSSGAAKLGVPPMKSAPQDRPGAECADHPLPGTGGRRQPQGGCCGTGGGASHDCGDSTAASGALIPGAR